MKQIKNLLAVAILATSFFTSCKKDDSSTSNNTVNNPANTFTYDGTTKNADTISFYFSTAYVGALVPGSLAWSSEVDIKFKSFPTTNTTYKVSSTNVPTDTSVYITYHNGALGISSLEATGSSTDSVVVKFMSGKMNFVSNNINMKNGKKLWFNFTQK